MSTNQMRASDPRLERIHKLRASEQLMHTVIKFLGFYFLVIFLLTI